MYKTTCKVPFSAPRVGSVFQDTEQPVWDWKGHYLPAKPVQNWWESPKESNFWERSCTRQFPRQLSRQQREPTLLPPEWKEKKPMREVKLWQFLSPRDRVLWLGTVLCHMKGVGKCWSVGYTHISSFKNSLRTKPLLHSCGSFHAQCCQEGLLNPSPTGAGRIPPAHLARAPKR